MELFLRTPHNYDMHAASIDSGLKCEDPTLAQQHFKEECDINTIVERFHITGELPQNVRMPMQGDFTGLTTFEQAMDAIRSAQESFNAMPAKVRERFQNDPGKLVEFCTDPENLPEAIKLGLADPTAPVAPSEPATTTSTTPQAKPAPTGA